MMRLLSLPAGFFRFFFLQILDQGLAGQCRYTVNDHCAGAANTLHTRTLPADAGCLFAIDIRDVVVIVDIVQYARHGVFIGAIVIEYFPIWIGCRRLLPQDFNSHRHAPYPAARGTRHRHS